MITMKKALVWLLLTALMLASCASGLAQDAPRSPSGDFCSPSEDFWAYVNQAALAAHPAVPGAPWSVQKDFAARLDAIQEALYRACRSRNWTRRLAAMCSAATCVTLGLRTFRRS
ncbi:MAG: hypothetical protein RSD95_06565 [Clostridia bacterium]